MNTGTLEYQVAAIWENRINIEYDKIFPYKEKQVICVSDSGKEFFVQDVTHDIIDSNSFEQQTLSNYIKGNNRCIKLITNPNDDFKLLISDGVKQYLITGNLQQTIEQNQPTGLSSTISTATDSGEFLPSKSDEQYFKTAEIPQPNKQKQPTKPNSPISTAINSGEFNNPVSNVRTTTAESAMISGEFNNPVSNVRTTTTESEKNIETQIKEMIVKSEWDKNNIDFTMSFDSTTMYTLSHDENKKQNVKIGHISIPVEKTMSAIIRSHHHPFILHDSKENIITYSMSDETTDYISHTYTIKPFTHIVSFRNYGYVTYEMNKSNIEVYTPNFEHIMTIKTNSKVSNLVQLNDTQYAYLDERKTIRVETIPDNEFNVHENVKLLQPMPLYIKKITNGIILVAYTDKIEMYFGDKKVIRRVEYENIINVYLYEPSNSDLKCIYVITRKYVYKLSLSLTQIEKHIIKDLDLTEQDKKITKVNIESFSKLVYVEHNSNVYIYVLKYNEVEQRNEIYMFKNGIRTRLLLGQIDDMMLINNSSQMFVIGDISYIYDYELSEETVRKIYEPISSATQIDNNLIISVSSNSSKINIHDKNGIVVRYIPNKKINKLSDIFSINDYEIILISNGIMTTINLQQKYTDQNALEFLNEVNSNTRPMHTREYVIKYINTGGKLNFNIKDKDNDFFDQIKLAINNTPRSFILVEHKTNKYLPNVDENVILQIIFTELGKYLTKENRFFIKEDTERGTIHRFKPISNLKGVDLINAKSDLYYLGMLVGFSLANQIPLGIKLHPIILYAMLNYTDSSSPNQPVVPAVTKESIIQIIEDYDKSFLNIEPYDCFRPTIASNNTRCQTNEETGEKLDYGNRRFNEEETVKDFTVRRINDMIKTQDLPLRSFIPGFKTVVTHNKKYSLSTLDVLITGMIEISFEKVKFHLIFNFNDLYGCIINSSITTLISSRSDVIMNDVKNIIINIMEMHQAESSEYSSTFIEALTGNPYIPILGYTKNPLTIKVVSSGKFETLICKNTMTIPCSDIFDVLRRSDIKNSKLYKNMSNKSLRKIIYDSKQYCI